MTFRRDHAVVLMPFLEGEGQGWEEGQAFIVPQPRHSHCIGAWGSFVRSREEPNGGWAVWKPFPEPVLLWSDGTEQLLKEAENISLELGETTQTVWAGLSIINSQTLFLEQKNLLLLLLTLELEHLNS